MAPSNKYQILRAELQNIRETIIGTAFSDAESQLNEQGAPTTAYLDIYWDKDHAEIRRLSDNARIKDLSFSLQLYYYPHLDQLFKLAINKNLYPA